MNGSGKTTLLRALVNEYPHRGVIQFHCGHDHSQPYPEAIGYVPQRLTLDARLPLTVRDFLALTLSHRPLFLGISKRVAAKSKEMLERVGVAEYLDVPVEGLSGGQLQRVLLALALEPQPELLLLDEPAAGIDFKDQKKFYELIASLNRELGVTVLLVSHDLNMVQAHAHDVLCFARRCDPVPGTAERHPHTDQHVARLRSGTAHVPAPLRHLSRIPGRKAGGKGEPRPQGRGWLLRAIAVTAKAGVTAITPGLAAGVRPKPLAQWRPVLGQPFALDQFQLLLRNVKAGRDLLFGVRDAKRMRVLHFHQRVENGLALLYCQCFGWHRCISCAVT